MSMHENNSLYSYKLQLCNHNHLYFFSPPPKKQQKQVTKKHLKKTWIPKKQPNKVGMAPQYFYGLSSLYLLTFFWPHTCTHASQSHTCHMSHISIANKWLQHCTTRKTSHCNLSFAATCTVDSLLLIPHRTLGKIKCTTLWRSWQELNQCAVGTIA